MEVFVLHILKKYKRARDSQGYFSFSPSPYLAQTETVYRKFEKTWLIGLGWGGLWCGGVHRKIIMIFLFPIFNGTPRELDCDC